MKIGNVDIGLQHSPCIIAEMSGNHNRSLDRALKIVESASASGAHLLKLQTYTPDTITLNVSRNEFVINSESSLWRGRSLYSLYEEAHTPWEWQKEIIEHSQNLGLTCFSSVFDQSSLEFLESLDVAAYKLASQEVVHLPLIREVAATGKPMIMSTGMASLGEIDEAVNTAIKAGATEFALLKCTSTYPADPKDSNILTIPLMRKIFGCEVGLSDHTVGIGAAISAVAHGATLIEKHLTLNRSDGGVDSAFSIEPHEMKDLVEVSEQARLALGKVFFGPTDSEFDSLSGRRSIYVSENVECGDVVTEKNVRVVRPNLGLPPKYYSEIIGKRFTKRAEIGTPLTWDIIG